MNAQVKTYEQRIADLIRRLGSDHDGEVTATVHVLKRLLASQSVSFTDLGNAIEKLATGGLAEAQMKQLFDAGYAKGAADAERKRIAQQAAHGLKPDGSTDWEAVALYCQREKSRLEANHHQFIDDMASRMTWGREPTDRQGTYLISLFRKLGGE